MRGTTSADNLILGYFMDFMSICFIKLTGRLVKLHSFLKRIFIIKKTHIAHAEVNLTGAFL